MVMTGSEPLIPITAAAIVTAASALLSGFTTEPLWLGVGFLYIASGIYFEVFYRAHVPRRAVLALVAIGGAIFIAVNRRWFVETDAGLLVTELLILLMFVLAWYLTYSILIAAAGHCPRPFHPPPPPDDT